MRRSFSKGPAGSADASCTPVLEAVQLTPTQVIATADPIADGTATENQGGGTDSSEGDDEGACSEADYKCVAADVSLTTYCLGKAVTPCPPGYACVGGSASKPACEVTADPNSPAVVPPPECEGSLKCIDAASFCDNGTISTCADGFACTGDEGAAACTAAAAPAGGETAAVTCTDPDQSCIAGADGGASTSYCIGGAVIPCDTGKREAGSVGWLHGAGCVPCWPSVAAEQHDCVPHKACTAHPHAALSCPPFRPWRADTTCSGDAGSAQCMAVVAPEDAPPPVESCSQENYACIDGSTYCFAGEVVACDAGERGPLLTGAALPCTASMRRCASAWPAGQRQQARY